MLWAASLITVVGTIDYLTGPEFGLSIFYLIPICLTAWFAGRRPGLGIAGHGAIAWLIAELLWHVNYSHPIVPFWNATVRLGLFMISAALTSEVAFRKKVELALRQQTDVLQSILDNMGDGVVVADREGKIILSNPTAERLLRTNLKGLQCDAILTEQNTYLPDMLTAYPSYEHPLTRAIRGESVDGAEMMLRHLEKDEVWLRATSRPLRDEKGDVRGGVMVLSDITPQRSLEKQIAEISEREQRRMGQDLHDGLCQHLVSTAFASAVLQNKLEEKKLSESKAAEGITDLINQGITQARALARGLYPVKLDDEGLASALEQLAENVQSLTTIQCDCRCESPVLIHDPIAGTNLYRIAQEAVNNAVKHSRAKKIVIELEAVEDELTLTVSDDGIGFPTPVKKGAGMGLSIMNYRARLISASLDIRRGTNGGTLVICSFINQPIQRSHERNAPNIQTN